MNFKDVVVIVHDPRRSLFTDEHIAGGFDDNN